MTNQSIVSIRGTSTGLTPVVAPLVRLPNSSLTQLQGLADGAEIKLQLEGQLPTFVDGLITSAKNQFTVGGLVNTSVAIAVAKWSPEIGCAIGALLTSETGPGAIAGCLTGAKVAPRALAVAAGLGLFASTVKIGAALVNASLAPELEGAGWKQYAGEEFGNLVMPLLMGSGIRGIVQTGARGKFIRFTPEPSKVIDLYPLGKEANGSQTWGVAVSSSTGVKTGELALTPQRRDLFPPLNLFRPAPPTGDSKQLTTSKTADKKGPQNSVYSVKGLYRVVPISSVELTAMPGGNPYFQTSNWPGFTKGKEGMIKKEIDGEFTGWFKQGAVHTAKAEFQSKYGLPYEHSRDGKMDLPEVKKIHDAVTTFMSRMAFSVGMVDPFRNIKNGKLVASYFPNLMPLYHGLATQAQTPEELNFVAATGTSAVILATDRTGKQWAQVQARSLIKNFPHAGNMGSSPAGMWSVKPEIPGNPVDFYFANEKSGFFPGGPHLKFKLPNLNNQSARQNVFREALEEIGLVKPDDFKPTPIGVAEDEVIPHKELQFELEYNGGLEKLIAISRQGIKNLVERTKTHAVEYVRRDPDLFPERTFYIEATPKAIAEMLVTAPNMPPTHSSNYFLLAINLLKKQGASEQQIKQWTDTTTARITRAATDMNHAVETFYQKNPEAFFLNTHIKDYTALNKLKTEIEQSGRTVEDVFKDTNLSPLVQQMLKPVLEMRQSADNRERTLLSAIGMSTNKIATPNHKGFDARRGAGKDQGLPSPAEIFTRLKNLGIQVQNGTTNF